MDETIIDIYMLAYGIKFYCRCLSRSHIMVTAALGPLGYKEIQLGVSQFHFTLNKGLAMDQLTLE